MEQDFSKETKDKKQYELAFLVASEDSSRDVLRLVAQHKIDVASEGQLKKINLSYKIKKLSEAYFGFLMLLSAPEDIKALEHDLKTAPGILRSLIMVLTNKQRANAGRSSGSREDHKMSARRPTRPAPQRAQALSNEALEKKIEEILQ